jgi:hypothetical protein
MNLLAYKYFSMLGKSSEPAARTTADGKNKGDGGAKATYFP